MGILFDSIITEDHITKSTNKKHQTWRSFREKSKGKGVILWGGGKACIDFIMHNRNKYNFLYLVDSNDMKWETTLEGIPIKSPDYLFGENLSDKIVLITSTAYMEDIGEQLRLHGIYDFYGWLEMEARTLKGKAVCFLVNVLKLFLYYLLPMKKRRILFGTGDYCCHQKYIAEKISFQKLNYDLIWLTNSNKQMFPKGIKIKKNTPFNRLYYHATSKVWFCNTNKELWIHKRKGQLYINTFHGSIPLKKICLDDENFLPDKYVRSVRHDSEMADYHLSSGQFSTSVWRSAMGYSGQCLEVGSPRLDILFKDSSEMKNVILSKLGLNEDSKIALYSPTYRQHKSGSGIISHSTDIYLQDFEKLRDTLTKRFGGEWYIFLRLHPSVVSDSGKMFYSNYVINANSNIFPDVYEILSFTDIIITDYSSLMFEASVKKIPVFLYMPDFQDYIDIRGFYFDMNEIPFMKALNYKELCDNIIDYNPDEYNLLLEHFQDKIGLIEKGDASEQVIDVIMRHVENW